MNGLSLFSGIGGLDVALSDWVRPIAYCEIDPYCQGVLLSRISEGLLINAPIWDDIRTLDGRIFSESIHILYGGFPCQDISIAGLGTGLAGKRSGLFFEIVRLAKEIKPSWIFLENVPAITHRGGLRVVREITEMGYDCRWCVISAASVGALHKRERWFLLAHATNQRSQRRVESRKPKITEFRNGCEDVSDTRCIAQGSEEESERPHDQSTGCCGFWETESGVGRVVDGIPKRMDRIKCLGNSVVSQQAKEAFKILMGIN